MEPYNVPPPAPPPARSDLRQQSANPYAETDARPLDTKKEDRTSLVFIDHTGKRFLFPFKSCKTWASFQSLIEQAYARIQDEQIKNNVMHGRFDILTLNGEIILPGLWDSVIRPWHTVWLSFWAKPTSPALRPHRNETTEIEDLYGSRYQSSVAESRRSDEDSDSYVDEDHVSVMEGAGPPAEVELENDQDEDEASESLTESEESEPLPQPPTTPRTVVTPTDRDGNRLSFLTDTKCIPVNSESNEESTESGVDATKTSSSRDMKSENLKILMALAVSSESRMTIQLHTLPGPENSSTSSSVTVRWYHLQGTLMDFAQFKTACLGVHDISQRLKRLTIKMLDKIEKEKLKTFVDGMFIEPGTVLRGEESDRDDSFAVIFSCIPHFEIQTATKPTPGKTDRLHPARSLMQSYYPYEPVRERDTEQAYNKFGNGPENSMIHVPLMWMMNIDTHAIVTCGYKPLSTNLVKSIMTVQEDIRGINTNIRLTDWSGRVLLYSPDECRTYFEMEQKIRELRLTAWSSDSESMQLLWTGEQGEQKVTPGNWLDIIKHRKLIFIDLSILDGQRARKLDETQVQVQAEAFLETNSAQNSIPPFFLWPHSTTKEDQKAGAKSHSRDGNANTSVNLGEDTTRQLFVPPEVRRSMNSLEQVERAMLSETLDEMETTHAVDRSFTSTKYYESLPENKMEHLRESFVSLLTDTANLGRGSSSRTRHQVVVDQQYSTLAAYVSGLFDTIFRTLKLFVRDVDKSTMLRKVWGAMTNIATIIEQVQKRGACKPDPEEYTNPEWHSPERRKRAWVVRSPSNSGRKGKSLEPPPENDALNREIRECRQCRHRHTYTDPNAALEHLRGHLQEESLDTENINNRLDNLSDANLKDWIVNDEQILIENFNAGHLAILSQANMAARILLSEATQLAQGVNNQDGKMSELYTFPQELLKSLQRLIVFYLAIERSIYHTHECFQKKGPVAHDNELPYSKIGLEVLDRFYDSAKLSLLAARKDLCRMASSESPDDYRSRLLLGPEYLCSWFMRKLLVKPVDNSMTAADLYREYLSTLQFQVNHRPSKRLLRSINLLQEELTALDRVNAWQTKLIENYSRVLDDTTYQNEIPQRRAMYAHERLLLSSCLDSLSDAHEDYTELINRCGPLSESTKQSAEINEEDHGKAILVFTVVTIIFLPLSFVTSYLGMNTSDIRDMSNKQSLFWEIAIPLTVVTMGSILLIVYNGDEIRDHITSYSRLLTGKQDTSTAARGISVAQRRRASKFTDSANTPDYKSMADEAEFALPWGRSAVPAPASGMPGAAPIVIDTGADMMRKSARFNLQDNLIQPTSRIALDSSGPYNKATRFSETMIPEPRIGRSSRQPVLGVPEEYPNPNVPTYLKIHKRYIDPETLDHYKVPWEYDPKDPSYRILLKYMEPDETDMLFEHTKLLKDRRAGRAGAYFTDEKPREYAWVRKKRKGRRRERVL
ncbi:hypothetical protein K469DRAFT_626882 [Zopfia rhizophila CBS 207.26]|uniref:Ubiquitin-like domain-containing protein n=1 Tax=Zopfia rhizophila CBS 207.26 TaxID=1314779 RepID=A0A6A6EEP8_9PEZI|nr:hypothetical protein K469DRAFT_626882 [Zopfia rhizophila CBS 207.26]